MKKHPEDDAVYMDPRALEFMRAWPDVPEVLRPVYARFRDAGLLWADPNADSDGRTWPGQLRLTENGKKLKEMVDGQSINFFYRPWVEPLMPGGDDPRDPERRIFKASLPVGAPGVPVPGHPSYTGGLKFRLARLENAFERLHENLKLFPGAR